MVVNSDSKVGLHVIAEKMKICSYVHVGKCSYLWVNSRPISSAGNVEFI